MYVEYLSRKRADSERRLGIPDAAAETPACPRKVEETQKRLSNKRPHYRRVVAIPGLRGRAVAISGEPSVGDTGALSAAFQIDSMRPPARVPTATDAHGHAKEGRVLKNVAGAFA